METGIHNTSEIGRLRKVMLHRPGQELENLMPEYLERLLFDDIPYLKEAQAEHDAFAQCLRDAGVDRLNISLDTPVYYICRRVLADNTPVLFSTDIVPCSLFGTTRTDGIDFTRPIFDILDEACGIQVSSTITHLRAAMGDPAVRHALALQRDQALLELSETCYSRLCRPVLRCRTFYTDFFDFALVRKLV